MSKPIASIQAALSALGYNPGAADGLFGPRTSAAAAAWLAAGGVPAHKPDADKPELYQGPVRHPVGAIIIHCSATPPTWMAGRSAADKVAEIRRWHMVDRGWSDIGYHWVIDRDGTLVRGRPETVVGAHTQGHNAGAIGICLIGGAASSADDQFSDHYTPAQEITLRQQIQAISMRAQIYRVSGHNDYAPKACPGFRVAPWLEEAS